MYKRTTITPFTCVLHMFCFMITPPKKTKKNTKAPDIRPQRGLHNFRWPKSGTTPATRCRVAGVKMPDMSRSQ